MKRFSMDTFSGRTMKVKRQTEVVEDIYLEYLRAYCVGVLKNPRADVTHSYDSGSWQQSQESGGIR